MFPHRFISYFLSIPLAFVLAGCPEPAMTRAPVSPAEPPGTEPVVVAPLPTPAPAPVASPTGLEILPSTATVALGGKLTLSIVNTGAKPYTYEFPGASSGCGRFRWSIGLVATKTGTTFLDEDESTDRPCSAVMIPPSTMTFPPGDRGDIVLDTSATFFVRDLASFSTKPAQLTAGDYEVTISGAGFSGTVTVHVI